MPPEWSAERTVDAALAAALVGEPFPDLAGAPCELLAEGWDNVAFLVAGEWVFRFPRRAVAVPLLDAECALLPALTPTLPLAVPVPERRGAPTERFPWPFAGYRHLPGTTADRAHLDDPERTACAEPLGRFLAALHAFPVDEARRLGAGPDPIGRFDVERRAARVRERLASVGEDPTRWEALLADVPPSTTPETLVHGDLYSRHVLVDDDHLPSGVIDWGDVHLGDPAVDLALAFAFLPEAARPFFFAAYGLIDEATTRRARFRALDHAAAERVYAEEVGDADLARESRGSLEGLAE